ncbi:MAG: hypothetical protein MK160_05760 [Rhodobacteraceae bacterium]|nr:hypothetical protein [Paracoccaceae bacterium]
MMTRLMVRFAGRTHGPSAKDYHNLTGHGVMQTEVAALHPAKRSPNSERAGMHATQRAQRGMKTTLNYFSVLPEKITENAGLDLKSDLC